MLSRQQKWRRLRHRVRNEAKSRVPLELFSKEGVLATSPHKPVLLKSFSDSGPSRADAAEGGARMRRSVSDTFVAPTRSLFTPAIAAPIAVKPKRASVSFLPRVEVVLIPTAKELAPCKGDIWWSRSDLHSFQRELISALPAGVNLKQNILSLGEVASFAGCNFPAVCDKAGAAPTAAVAAPAAAVAVFPKQQAVPCFSNKAASTLITAVSAALAVVDLSAISCPLGGASPQVAVAV